MRKIITAHRLHEPLAQRTDTRSAVRPASYHQPGSRRWTQLVPPSEAELSSPVALVNRGRYHQTPTEPVAAAPISLMSIELDIHCVPAQEIQGRMGHQQLS